MAKGAIHFLIDGIGNGRRKFQLVDSFNNERCAGIYTEGGGEVTARNVDCAVGGLQIEV